MFINNLLNKKTRILLFLFTILNSSLSYAEEANQIIDKGEIVIQEIQDGAVILLFHSFGDDNQPDINIGTEQLDNLINYIKNNNFNVIPLAQAVEIIQNGGKLPNKSVVITIDDAFKSVYTVAYPKFKQAGFPFTLFVSSGKVNDNNSAYLNWNEIIEMASNGVDIQAHTVNHSHMTKKEIKENHNEIDSNINDIIKNTNIKPIYFAYPYGEANQEIIEMVKSKNIVAGFSQHSGVYNNTSDQYYIPRFPINEKWGTLERLKLILNTKPFKIKSITPNTPYIKDNNPPNISVVVDDSIDDMSQLNCFRSDTGKVSLEKSDKSFQMVFTTPFKTGRTRINCTIPNKDGTYKWLGLMFTNDK